MSNINGENYEKLQKKNIELSTSIQHLLLKNTEDIYNILLDCMNDRCHKNNNNKEKETKILSSIND